MLAKTRRKKKNNLGGMFGFCFSLNCVTISLDFLKTFLSGITWSGWNFSSQVFRVIRYPDSIKNRPELSRYSIIHETCRIEQNVVYTLEPGIGTSGSGRSLYYIQQPGR